MTTDVVSILKNGGVGVLATDTLYGVIGQALDQKAVARVYEVKRRCPDKPFIILIGNYADLAPSALFSPA